MGVLHLNRDSFHARYLIKHPVKYDSHLIFSQQKLPCPAQIHSRKEFIVATVASFPQEWSFCRRRQAFLQREPFFLALLNPGDRISL